MCVATSGAADTVLLEVTPPATTQTIGGVRFLRLSDGFSSNQGDDETEHSAAEQGSRLRERVRRDGAGEPVSSQGGARSPFR